MARRCRFPAARPSQDAASSPRNDLVKNFRVHPTHWLISTQVDVVDYESMETADLKALCKERGIRPLPVRRLVIEDLRFYDAHGVAGVRHPATKQLSLPKKKR